jgi:hypothetical protein
MALLHLKHCTSRRAAACHERIPGLNKLPLPAVSIIVGLVIANALVWIAVGTVLVQMLHPISTCQTTNYSKALPSVRTLIHQVF